MLGKLLASFRSLSAFYFTRTCLRKTEHVLGKLIKHFSLDPVKSFRHVKSSYTENKIAKSLFCLIVNGKLLEILRRLGGLLAPTHHVLRKLKHDKSSFCAAIFHIDN